SADLRTQHFLGQAGGLPEGDAKDLPHTRTQQFCGATPRRATLRAFGKNDGGSARPLVPKLRLGTPSSKLRFAGVGSVRPITTQSFPAGVPKRSLGTRGVTPPPTRILIFSERSYSMQVKRSDRPDQAIFLFARVLPGSIRVKELNTVPTMKLWVAAADRVVRN